MRGRYSNLAWYCWLVANQATFPVIRGSHQTSVPTGAGDCQVFVEFGSMDIPSLSEDFKMAALARGAMP